MLFHSPPPIHNPPFQLHYKLLWADILGYKNKTKKVDTYLHAKYVSGNHIVLKQAEHSAAFINISKSSQFRP